MDPVQNDTHRLVAILFADMVGYSRLRQKVALKLQAEMHALARECLDRHHGRLQATMGDGFFAEFPAAFDAIQFAFDLQDRIATRNCAPGIDQRFKLRLGIHFGDVVVKGNKIEGTNVVIAARTEPLASHGGICMTEQIWEQVHEELPQPARKLGKLRIKGFPKGLCFYNVYAAGAGWPAQLRHRAKLFFNWPGRVPAALVISAALLALAIWLRPFAEPLLDYVLPPTPVQLINRAAKQLDRFDLDGHTLAAINYLQKAIDRGASQSPAPDWIPDAHGWLGYAYWRRFGRTKSPEDRQKAYVESAAATNRLSALAYQVQGLVAFDEGGTAEAGKLLSRANELYKGQNCDVLVSLAEVNIVLNRREEAEAKITSAYAVEAKPWNAYVSLGSYEYQYRTNASAALTNFEQALRMVPDSPLSWNDLCGALVDQDKPVEALKSIDALLHKFPRLRENPEFCSTKGTIYLALTNPLASADWFLAAAHLRPVDYRFWGNAGLALLDVTNRQTQARECFTMAVEAAQLSRKDSPDCSTLADIAMFQAGLGNTNDAQTNIKEALQQCGGNEHVRAAAGETFTLLGDTNRLQLLEQSQNVIANTPSNSVSN